MQAACYVIMKQEYPLLYYQTTEQFNQIIQSQYSTINNAFNFRIIILLKIRWEVRSSGNMVIMYPGVLKIVLRNVCMLL